MLFYASSATSLLPASSFALVLTFPRDIHNGDPVDLHRTTEKRWRAAVAARRSLIPAPPDPFPRKGEKKAGEPLAPRLANSGVIASELTRLGSEMRALEKTRSRGGAAWHVGQGRPWFGATSSRSYFHLIDLEEKKEEGDGGQRG